MSKLKDILQRKKNEAHLNPGKTTTNLELESGLNIRIRKETALGKYTIFLSRKGTTPPSQIEIKTFVDHWPEPAKIEDDFTTGVVFFISER